MQQPSPDDYGLTQLDVSAAENTMKRVAWWMRAAGILTGVLASFLWAAATDGNYGFFFAPWFALLGFGVGVVSEDWVAATLDARVERYRRFTSVQLAFEAWDRRTRIEFWQSLSGRRFEQELALLFRRQGYNVELTPHSGDKGIDLILRQSGRTTIVQCKQTRKPVAPAIVRELYGALIASKADDAILASVGGAAPGVYDFCAGKPLRVMSLTEIVALHNQLDQ